MKIGIDIGGSHICIGVIDQNKIIDTVYTHINIDEIGDIEKFIYNNCVYGINKLLLRIHTTIDQIEKIGIAFPGKVKDNIVYNLPNLGIKQFNISKELRKIFNTNIIIQNDANCAAYAEKILGSMKEYSDFIFLCIGTGIGGAVINDNRLLTAKRSTGFEFGHMIIHQNGRSCNCGNKGCFERYASMKKFKKDVKEYLNVDPNLEGEKLFEITYNAYKNNEITKLVEDYIEELAFGISNLINIFEPEAICIGGGFVYYKDILLERLIEKLKQKDYIMDKDEEIPEIKLAKLGNEAGVIGSVLI